jgi:hypothetical protein
VIAQLSNEDYIQKYNDGMQRRDSNPEWRQNVINAAKNEERCKRISDARKLRFSVPIYRESQRLKRIENKINKQTN